MMKLMMVASALSLVACGAGEPWDGGWHEPPPDAGGAGRPTGTAGIGGLAGAGGTGQLPEGGFGGVGTAGTATGGYPTEVGGESSEGGNAGTATGGYAGGTAGEGGETSEGGHGGTATGGTGSAGEGGASQAGSAGTGTGGSGPDLSCLANVSHCFDAAANCFEYSPGSDCDQIVDVCAAMQADCEGTP